VPDARLLAQAGDMTLVDTLGGVQLAISAAISNAFKTPEARAHAVHCACTAHLRMRCSVPATRVRCG
jgi:hypothetical protein